MAKLMFETPEENECDGCLALETEMSGFCRYYREFLKYEDGCFVKCKQCKQTED